MCRQENCEENQPMVQSISMVFYIYIYVCVCGCVCNVYMLPGRVEIIMNASGCRQRLWQCLVQMALYITIYINIIYNTFILHLSYIIYKYSTKYSAVQKKYSSVQYNAHRKEQEQQPVWHRLYDTRAIITAYNLLFVFMLCFVNIYRIIYIVVYTTYKDRATCLVRIVYVFVAFFHSVSRTELSLICFLRYYSSLDLGFTIKVLWGHQWIAPSVSAQNVHMQNDNQNYHFSRSI